jgi:glycosyltransferase involved in cell wall biosynthesis
LPPEAKFKTHANFDCDCTYDGAQYLQKQLDTFASQRYPPCELIVCDSFPVRVFKNARNLGSTRNFERAIGICDGDLIALSDQDDEWYPDKLARMHRLFEELPEALAAFGNADLIDDGSVFAGRKLWKRIDVPPSPGKKGPYAYTGMVSSLFKLDYIATGATMVFRSTLRDQFVPIPGSWPHDAWLRQRTRRLFFLMELFADRCSGC